MTFQQLEYIVLVDQTRHFNNAATMSGVTQSTLSGAIAKLEQEIDVVIFDRSKHPIEPTPLGKQIIEQAKVILHNSQQLRDLAQNEKTGDHGELLIGISPSVSPSVYPRMSQRLRMQYPGIRTVITEMTSETLIAKLQRSELDMLIIPNTGTIPGDLMSIDLYSERFMLYVSSSSALCQREWVRPEDLMSGELWTLRSMHDRYSQISGVIHQKTVHTTTLDSGSLCTLVQLIDANGGFTLLPELYRNVLTPNQQRNLKPIQGPNFIRTICIVIRRDYMRERMLNIIADSVRHSVPQELFCAALNRETIKI